MINFSYFIDFVWCFWSVLRLYSVFLFRQKFLDFICIVLANSIRSFLFELHCGVCFQKKKNIYMLLSHYSWIILIIFSPFLCLYLVFTVFLNSQLIVASLCVKEKLRFGTNATNISNMEYFLSITIEFIRRNLTNPLSYNSNMWVVQVNL